jgi:hypothetical protein
MKAHAAHLMRCDGPGFAWEGQHAGEDLRVDGGHYGVSFLRCFFCRSALGAPSMLPRSGDIG